MNLYHTAIAILGMILSTTSIAGATDLAETTGVDSFSSDFQAPTVFTLEVGSNFLSGEVGRIVDEFTDSGTLLSDGTFTATDADYFTVIVPSGHRLDQIFVNRYDEFGRGFAAYAPGTQFAPPTDLGGGVTFFPFADGALFDGPTEFTPLDPPSELFVGSSAPVDASDGGFNVDFLPAGSFALLIQENQIVTVDYEWEFVVTAIPEPASGLLLLLGISTGLVRGRGSRWFPRILRRSH